MRKIIFFLLIFTSLYSKDILDKEFSTLQNAVEVFKDAVTTYKTNVYLLKDEKNMYHIQYDPDSKMETENSFLQIDSSKNLKTMLEQYKRVKSKKHLYIKIFNGLYFLRLSNQSPKHTRDMFITLQENFPDIYYSRSAKKTVKKTLELDNKKHEIVFLKDRKTKLKANLLKDTVFSLSPKQKVPALKMKKIYRNANLERIHDLKDYAANFSIIRGDVLGVSNAGLYGFEPYTNYGILCSHSEEILYLVSKKEIKSIYDLRRKKISIGNISDISQVYLKDIANASGVMLDINFKSFNFKDSIKKIRLDEIDAFFMFAPKKSILEVVKNGLHVSTMPNDFLKILNDKQGLKNVKYKIDGRLVRSYTVPNFVVGIVETLDTDIAKKVRGVVESFGCYKQVGIPDPFYGTLHPELMNIMAALKEEAAALAAQKKLLEGKTDELSIQFYKEQKVNKSKVYYYQITNVSSNDINLTFQTAKTKALDEYAFKPRHLFKMQSKKSFIEVKANKKKLISFKYSNPFSTRLKDIELELKFKRADLNGQEFSIPLIIGDE